LQQLYTEKIDLKNNLTTQIQECQVKLTRAIKLTGGLKSEQARWTEDI
jgi:dynein heavy chain